MFSWSNKIGLSQGILVLIAKLAEKQTTQLLTDSNFMFFVNQILNFVIVLSALENFGIRVNKGYIQVVLFLYEFIKDRVERAQTPLNNRPRSAKPVSDFKTELSLLIDSVAEEFDKPFFTKNETVYTFNVEKAKKKHKELGDQNEHEDHGDWSKHWKMFLERKRKFENVVKIKKHQDEFEETKAKLFGKNDTIFDSKQASSFIRSKRNKNKSIQISSNENENELNVPKTNEIKSKQFSNRDTNDAISFLQIIIIRFNIREKFVDEVRLSFVEKLGTQANTAFEIIQSKIKDHWLADNEGIFTMAVKLKLLIGIFGISYYEILELLVAETPSASHRLKLETQINPKKVLKKLIFVAIDMQKLGEKKLLLNSIHGQTENGLKRAVKFPAKHNQIGESLNENNNQKKQDRHPEEIQNHEAIFARNDHCKNNIKNNCVFIESYFEKIKKLIEENRKRNSIWSRNFLMFSDIFDKIQENQNLTRTIIFDFCVQMFQRKKESDIFRMLSLLRHKLEKKLLKIIYHEFFRIYQNLLKTNKQRFSIKLIDKVCAFFVLGLEIFNDSFLSNEIDDEMLYFLSNSFFLDFKRETHKIKLTTSCNEFKSKTSTRCNAEKYKVNLGGNSVKFQELDFKINLQHSNDVFTFSKLFKMARSITMLIKLYLVIQTIKKSVFGDRKITLLKIASKMLLFSKTTYIYQFNEMLENDLLWVIKTLVKKKSRECHFPGCFWKLISIFVVELSSWTNFKSKKIENSIKTSFGQKKESFIPFNQHSKNIKDDLIDIKLNSKYTKNKCEIIFILLCSEIDKSFIGRNSENWNFEIFFALKNVEEELALFEENSISNCEYFETKKNDIVLCQSTFKKIIADQSLTRKVSLAMQNSCERSLELLNCEIKKYLNLYVADKLSSLPRLSEGYHNDIRKSIYNKELFEILISTQGRIGSTNARSVFDFTKIKQELILEFANERLWISEVFEKYIQQVFVSQFYLTATFGEFSGFIQEVMSDDHKFSILLSLSRVLLCQFFESICFDDQRMKKEDRTITIVFGGEFRILFFKAPIEMDWKKVEQMVDQVTKIHELTMRVEIMDIWKLHQLYSDQLLTFVNKDFPLRTLVIIKNFILFAMFVLASFFHIINGTISQVFIIAELLIVSLLFVLLMIFTLHSLLKINVTKRLAFTVVLRNGLYLFLCGLALALDFITQKSIGNSICLLLGLAPSSRLIQLAKQAKALIMVFIILLFTFIAVFLLIYWNNIWAANVILKGCPDE